MKTNVSKMVMLGLSIVVHGGMIQAMDVSPANPSRVEKAILDLRMIELGRWGLRSAIVTSNELNGSSMLAEIGQAQQTLMTSERRYSEKYTLAERAEAFRLKNERNAEAAKGRGAY